MSRTVSSWHAAEASGDTDLQHNQGEESMLPSREYWRSKRFPLRPPLLFCGVISSKNVGVRNGHPFASSLTVLRCKSYSKALAFEAVSLCVLHCGFAVEISPKSIGIRNDPPFAVLRWKSHRKALDLCTSRAPTAVFGEFPKTTPEPYCPAP